MNVTIKYILFFILFCFIHYAEGFLSFGGISAAQLWKLPLLVALVVYNFTRSRNRTLFENSGYVLSIQNIFSVEIFINPLTNIVNASKLLPLMLFYGYWVGKFRARVKTLVYILYSFAQYIILSTIPVHLGIIKPLRKVASAEQFGIEGLGYFAGLFGSFHSAASFFCAAILVLLNGFILGHFKGRLSKLYNALIIMLGVYSIFKSYARTGWLMLFVGVIMFIDLSNITKKKLRTYLLCFVGCTGALLFFYSTSEALQVRISGKNTFTGTGDSGVDLSGSGRSSFWANGVNCWLESPNMYEVLFGRGRTRVLDNNLEHSNIRVFSHSQFVEMLAQHGFIAIILLLVFYYSLYIFIVKRRHSQYYRLNLALFWANIVFAIFQQEMYFNYAIIFSITLALSAMDKKHFRT